MDINEQLVMAVKDGLRDGIKAKLANSYNNPLDKLLVDVLAKHDADMRTLLGSAITSALGDEGFREEIRRSVRHKLASTLVQRFGGELEKQVNVLKSDPTTRARITLAIEEIVKARTA